MHEKRSEGTISVFLALVLMVMITFCCSIVEVTRIQIAQLQAQRSLQSAAQSVLASYDSQLQSQYGLFGRDFSDMAGIRGELLRYAGSADMPKEDIRTETAFRPYEVFGDITRVAVTSSLTEPTVFDGQIQKFMALRAPFCALEPFLEQYALLGDAAKTSAILEEKATLDASLTSFQDSYVALEGLIEGFIVEENESLSRDAAGGVQLKEVYVKKIVVQDGYSLPVYGQKEIPDVMLRNALNLRAWDVDRTLRSYSDTLTRAKAAMASGAALFFKMETLKDERSDLKEDRKALRGRLIDAQQAEAAALSTQIEDINDKIDSLDDRLATLKQEMGYFIELYRMYEADMNDNYLPELARLVASDQVGYIGVHQAALEQIDLVRSQAKQLLAAIKTFKIDLKSQDMGSLEQLKVQMQEEAALYEALLAQDASEEMGKMISLSQMEKQIGHNLSILQNLKPEVEMLQAGMNQLPQQWILNLAEGDRGKAEDLAAEFDIDGETAIGDLQESEGAVIHDLAEQVSEAAVRRALEQMEGKLDGYIRELYFDYGKMPVEPEESEKVMKWMEIGRQLFPNFDMPESISIEDMDYLPSRIRMDETGADGGGSVNGGDASVSPGRAVVQYETDAQHIWGIWNVDDGEAQDAQSVKPDIRGTEVFAFLGDMGTSRVSDLLAEIYLNEYAVGMFNNLSETGKNAVTLTQFSKSEHYLNCEAEYILAGNDSDIENALTVVGIIFTLRIALNMIAVLMDSDKMARLNELGTAIAGWWSLGIGTAVIVAGLVLLWATVESVSDVQHLICGDRVPLIKTAATWQTDFMNGLKGEAAKAAKDSMADGGGMNALKKITEPDYNDYLRFLLMSPMLDEETKLYRMMDLIQMNMEKTRQEPVRLERFLTSIEVDGRFQLKPLFVDTLQGEGAYTFEHRIRAAY